MNLLLVDDDTTLRKVLSKALTKRGYHVSAAANVIEAESMATENSFEFAIVDLNMPGDSGLTLIPKLCLINPNIRIVVVTGYASINTAVEAIKLGAINYLTKPADTDEIIEMFNKGKEDVLNNAKPLSQVEWDHIQEVLNACDGNVSAAAKKLGMHRRTLQRKLKKKPGTDTTSTED
ncbi:MAG: response regulator [Proteobacteria bacterium]|nr:response regulator [Pseudomonadota bacterium]NOG61413.1 response regulator [Pseudomonadota bacterium]